MGAVMLYLFIGAAVLHTYIQTQNEGERVKIEKTLGLVGEKILKLLLTCTHGEIYNYSVFYIAPAGALL